MHFLGFVLNPYSLELLYNLRQLHAIVFLPVQMTEALSLGGAAYSHSTHCNEPDNATIAREAPPQQWLLAPGFWLPAQGSQLLAPVSAPGSGFPAPGFWLPAPRSQLSAPGSRLLATSSPLPGPSSPLPAHGSQPPAPGSPPNVDADADWRRRVLTPSVAAADEC